VLEQIAQVLSAAAPQGEATVVPLYSPRRSADAQVFLRRERRESPPAGAGALAAGSGALAAAREALAALPEVAAVTARGGTLSVRFADEALARLGERLEAGDAGAMDARGAWVDTDVVVNFCDANPTKALHIGHLRNIAVGQALAGVLAAAGARVTRQSQVSDYCRSMGEALAGYAELPAHLTPHTLGVKSDHFVGECFARYAGRVAEHTDDGEPPAEVSPAADDPALSAEAAVRDDLAEELLRRLRAGDPKVVERWQRLRAWALEGQAQTLAALGVRLDRQVHEFDSRPLTEWIVETGLAAGLLTRTAAGAVVYETRDAERPRLLLARADGFPTQHLRTFALWHAEGASLNGTRTVEVVGEEWYGYVRYHGRLMERIAPGRGARHPHNNVLYGMVTVEGAPVKSSGGRPPLVDGLLERLAASPELAELAARSEGRLAPEHLAATVALGFYLGRPTRQPVDLTLTEMLDLRGGVGWDLARAAAHAWSPRFDGPPDPAPAEGRYRQAVLRSQIHRQLVARAAAQLDPHDVARFYGHLSRRYVAASGEAAGTQPEQARVARAMRTVLGAGMRALGMPAATPQDGAAR
jgi:arginyl-tRNA synthetase